MAACYVARPSHPRHMTSFLPRFPSHDLAPLFRLFDDSTFESPFISRPAPRLTFQPRFDVLEKADSFHLNGDLPGLEQKDIQIEFVDQNTLVVRGRTVKESSSGTPPAAPAVEDSGKGKQIADAPSSSEAGAAANDTPSNAPASPALSSSSYHKATVEDEFVDVQSEHAAATTSENGATSPSATPANNEVAKPATTTASEQAAKKQQNEASGRYWVSERSVGEFQRSFNFPGQIDQEGVTASLKNGVLSVVVPKAVRREPRRIVVE